MKDINRLQKLHFSFLRVDKHIEDDHAIILERKRRKKVSKKTCTKAHRRVVNDQRSSYLL